jgi:hypothetical protein
VRSDECQPLDTDLEKHARGEIDRERESEARRRQNTEEREREVALCHVELSRWRECPPQVVDEQPKAKQHRGPRDSQQFELKSQQGHDECGESPDDQPQLDGCESPGVQRSCRPDGDELRHRAHDGETDPPREQNVQMRQSDQSRQPAECCRRAQDSPSEQEAKRHQKVA